MLNAVSSGSRLTNVTPVRSGESSSKSWGSQARPQPASLNPATSSSLDASGIGSGADSAWRGEQLGDLAATPTGGPGGEDARGRVVGRLSGVPSRRDRPSASLACRWASSSALARQPDPDRLPAPGSEHEMQA